MAEAEAEAIGVEINTSAAVSFSVGNGVVLTIATGASLEQQDELPQSIEEAVYEHGRIAWTGSTVWAAAVPLARHLGGLAQDWASTSVCELGAGCGLCGLAAVALGAKRVVLTDLELKMCQRNADANFHGADRDRVCVRELHWGRGGNGGKRCCGGLCTHEGFDMIIGSDLIYTIGAAEAVAETMSMLSKPGTVALLCNPETVHHFKFQESMEKFGFRCEKLVLSQAVPSFRGRMVLYSCTMVGSSKFTTLPCSQRRLALLLGVVVLSAVALVLSVSDSVRV